MRTIKRNALPLNKDKKIDLTKLCRAYSDEKRHWLGFLQNWDFQALLGLSNEDELRRSTTIAIGFLKKMAANTLEKGKRLSCSV
jgi:hypothetical protein